MGLRALFGESSPACGAAAEAVVPIVLILITSPLCTHILLILISDSTMEVEIRKEVDSPTTQW